MKNSLPLIIIMLIIVLSSSFFAWKGIDMHRQVNQEETVFHQLQTEYFSLAKSSRDNAATDSELNKQLVEIMNYPSELLSLKLVGVGNILTGIFILLLGILLALISMPLRISSFIKK